MIQNIIISFMVLVGWVGFTIGLFSGKVYRWSSGPGRSSGSFSYSFSDYPVQFIFEYLMMTLVLLIFTAVAIYMWKQYFINRNANQTLNRTEWHFRSNPTNKVHFPFVVPITLRRPRFTPPRQTENILFCYTILPVANRGSRAHNGSSAIRPITVMLESSSET